MITVTKRILESEKTSKQQYIAIIVVLSVHTNIAPSYDVLCYGNKKNTTIIKK
jgi:hypothetical protein